MGSRNYTSPFGMYESLLWRGAWVGGESGVGIFSIVRRGRHRFGNSAPTILERIEGAQDETRWISPCVHRQTHVAIAMRFSGKRPIENPRSG